MLVVMRIADLRIWSIHSSTIHICAHFSSISQITERLRRVYNQYLSVSLKSRSVQSRSSPVRSSKKAFKSATCISNLCVSFPPCMPAIAASTGCQWSSWESWQECKCPNGWRLRNRARAGQCTKADGLGYEWGRCAEHCADGGLLYSDGGGGV